MNFAMNSRTRDLAISWRTYSSGVSLRWVFSVNEIEAFALLDNDGEFG